MRPPSILPSVALFDEDGSVNAILGQREGSVETVGANSEPGWITTEERSSKLRSEHSPFS